MVNKLKSVIPFSWFRDSTPIIDAVHSGFAWCASMIQENITDATLQTRIKTTEGQFVDTMNASGGQPHCDVRN